MLDIKFIRENREAFVRAVQVKHLAESVDIDELLKVDERRRSLIEKSESFRARRNELSSKIPKLSKEERPAVIAEVKGIKTEMAEAEAELETVKETFHKLMLMVPQLPGDDVPEGAGEDDNVLVRTWGEPRTFDFKPRDHEELGELLDIIDKPRAAKFAGARAYLLKGAGAMLEMAVLRLAMDVCVERGFTPVLGPLMVNAMALEGTGFFPFGAEDTYHVEKDDKWLIGTSEVHLVSVHANEILEESDLPVRYVGQSACFRREAGSYGRDTRGIYRVHQFSKVEQVIICKDDDEASKELHMQLLDNAEEVLRRQSSSLTMPRKCFDVWSCHTA